MAVSFSRAHLYLPPWKVKRAHGAQAVKLDGKFSWNSEVRLVSIPAPWPESQETHRGNCYTQQNCTTSFTKKQQRRNQIFTAKKLQPRMHITYDSLCLFSPPSRCNHAFCSESTRNKQTLNSNKINKKHKVSGCRTANNVAIVNYNYCI